MFSVHPFIFNSYLILIGFHIFTYERKKLDLEKKLIIFKKKLRFLKKKIIGRKKIKLLFACVTPRVLKGSFKKC